MQIPFSFFAGSMLFSCTAEFRSLEQGLDWSKILKICQHSQSASFLCNFQYALFLLSSAPSFLLPKSLRRVFASSIFNLTAVNFWWMRDHAGFPGCEFADFLAKVEAFLFAVAILFVFSSPLFPKSSIFSLRNAILYIFVLVFKFYLFLTKQWTFSLLQLWSRLGILSFCLWRDQSNRKKFCLRQWWAHKLSIFTSLWASQKTYFGSSFSIFNLWF